MSGSGIAKGLFRPVSSGGSNVIQTISISDTDTTFTIDGGGTALSSLNCPAIYYELGKNSVGAVAGIVEVNGDSVDGNYINRRMIANNSSITTGANAIARQLLTILGTDEELSRGTIRLYGLKSGQKAMLLNIVLMGNNEHRNTSFQHNSTAETTSIDFSLASGQFASGTAYLVNLCI